MKTLTWGQTSTGNYVHLLSYMVYLNVKTYVLRTIPGDLLAYIGCSGGSLLPTPQHHLGDYRKVPKCYRQDHNLSI